MAYLFILEWCHYRNHLKALELPMKMVILKQMNEWKQRYLEFLQLEIFVKKHLRQIVTATGDGSIAAQSAQHYVEELKEELK